MNPESENNESNLSAEDFIKQLLGEVVVEPEVQETAPEVIEIIEELPEEAAPEETEEEETSEDDNIEIIEVIEPETEAKPFGTIEATEKVEDALAFGGIDYEVETFAIKPVLVGTEEAPVEGEPAPEWVIPTFTGIRRVDDKKVVFAVLRDTYTPFQNRQILEYVKPLLEVGGGEFTRVGSLDNGAQVFAYITLNETVTLPGGKEAKVELVLNSSHNGAKCLELKVVLTIDGATIKASRAYGFRHTKNVHLRTSEAIKILEFKDSFVKDLGNKVTALAGVTVSDVEASDWLKKFLDFPKQADIPVHAAKVAAHDRLLEAFKKAVAGGNTRLALALAVAHDRAFTSPTKDTKHFVNETEARFKSSLNGTSARKLEEAWVELLK